LSVFFLFLLAVAAGSLSTLYWIPEEDLGRGYFQMNALVVLCFLGLATALVAVNPFRPFGEGPAAGIGLGSLVAGLFGAFGYWAAVWRQRWYAGRWAVTLALAGAGSALLIAGHHLSPVGALPYQAPLLAASLVASAALVGWSLITMLLGHWYLVAPRLTFRHLTLFCWVLLAAVVARGLAVGLSLALAARLDAAIEPHPWRLLVGFEGEGAFFWFRILWGLVLPLALALMSQHFSRRRAYQSSTGIHSVLVVGSYNAEISV